MDRRHGPRARGAISQPVLNGIQPLDPPALPVRPGSGDYVSRNSGARTAVLILEEVARRDRHRAFLRTIVMEAFEPDPEGRVKRSDVYRYVGQRLQRPVSNELCILVRDSLAEMDDVMLSVSDGRARFYGLKPKAYG